MVFSATSMLATAQDSLEQVLDEIKATQSSRYSYIEVREMALLKNPWIGSGMMFITPDKMLIQQQQPRQTLVLISGEDFHYAEPGRNIYLHKTIDSLAVGSGPGVFLSFIYGKYDSNSLGVDYASHFSTTAQDWTLSLTPHDENAVNNIELSGETGQGANQIRLDYQDGDSTLWTLNLERQGKSVAKALEELVMVFSSRETRPVLNER